MRIRALLVERGWLVVLAVVVGYALVASTHVVEADNAEFATRGAVGGRAHPSGYPLYVLLLRAFAWIPAASAAHRAALITIAIAACAVAVLHAACRAWGASAGAANLACAIYAASPIVVRVHTEAEVFALNALVVASVLYVAAARGPLRGIARAAMLGAIGGLGLADHLTCALVAAVGLVGVARGIREASRPAAAAGAAVAAFVLGLMPYAYLAIARDDVSFGAIDSFGDLVAFATRRDYGGTALSANATDVSAGASLFALVHSLARAWLFALPIAGVALLVARALRPTTEGEPRAGWIALAASFALAGPVLALRFNIPLTAIGLTLTERFHLLPIELLAIPCAIGLDSCWRWARSRVRIAPRPAHVGIVAIAMYATLLVATLPALQSVHSPAMELGVRNVLRSLPPRAIAIVVSEDQCFGAEYLQRTELVRGDVTMVCATLTTRTWYAAKLARSGVVIPVGANEVIAPATARALLATDRPLFVDDAQTAILGALPSYPLGVLQRVLPADTPRPSPVDIAAENRALYAAFDLHYDRPSRGDGFAAIAHLRYAHTWRQIAAALAAAGRDSDARDALAIATQVAPD